MPISAGYYTDLSYASNHFQLILNRAFPGVALGVDKHNITQWTNNSGNIDYDLPPNESWYFAGLHTITHELFSLEETHLHESGSLEIIQEANRLAEGHLSSYNLGLYNNGSKMSDLTEWYKAWKLDPGADIPDFVQDEWDLGDITPGDSISSFITESGVFVTYIANTALDLTKIRSVGARSAQYMKNKSAAIGTAGSKKLANFTGYDLDDPLGSVEARKNTLLAALPAGTAAPDDGIDDQWALFLSTELPARETEFGLVRG